MKKTKIFIISVFILILLSLALYFDHYYCDNVYWAVRYGEQSVVQLSDGNIRVPKDDPDAFYRYMNENGWDNYDRLGSVGLFSKDEEKKEYRVYFKKYYALYIDVTQE